MNNLKKDHGTPSFVRLRGEVAECGEGIAKLFSSHFGSVYSTVSALEDLLQADCSDQLIASSVLSEELLGLISGLDSNAKADPDAVPETDLKNCASSLSEPLCKISNLALSQGHLPAS